MRCLSLPRANVLSHPSAAVAAANSQPRCCFSKQRQLRQAQWQSVQELQQPQVGAQLRQAAAAGVVAPTAAAVRGSSCRCSSTGPDAAPVPPLVVVEGDIVTFHMTCKAEDGAVLESSREAGEPLSFEIGAGDITGNPLFQAFDGALRGLAVNDLVELEISGGDWKQELLFTVPRDHPEIERLEGRYKNMGGLAKDLAVELANGTMAVVVESTPEYVKLDANNMMSGKKLMFELEVLGIERPES